MIPRVNAAEFIPSPSGTIVFSAMMILARLLLACYINYIINYEGYKKPWHFPVSQFFPVKVEDGQAQKLSKDQMNLTALFLSKTYQNIQFPSLVINKLTAVSDFNQVFECGNVYAILGKNGAGKSTIVKILSGMMAPTKGEGFLCGHSIADTMKIRKTVGICSQDDIFFEHWTAWEHVWFYSQFRSVQMSTSELKTFAYELLSDVGLAAVMHKKANTFSGGMKRRLSFALSLIGPHTVLFLDEPTAGLDPLSRELIWKVVDKVKKDSIVILTSHSMEEVEYLGDQVLIMKQGEICAQGSPLHLKSTHGSSARLKLTASRKLLALNCSVDTLEKWIFRCLPRCTLVSITHRII